MVAGFRKSLIETISRAITTIPPDVKSTLSNVRRKERNPIASAQLAAIIENVALAEKGHLPVCQDTGLPFFFVRVGRNFRLGFDLENEIRKAIAEATRTVPLRPNVVEPLSRKNSGDNTGERAPFIQWEIVDGGELEIEFVPKGAGSANQFGIGMLGPNEGIAGIRRFVLSQLAEIGGKACPPYIIGLGIGGTADIAAQLAKRASVRDLRVRAKEKNLAALERELAEEINSLGIGPMGLGGDTTCLAVAIETAACHTASLPVAMDVMCWAARRARLKMNKRGEIKISY